MIGRVRTGQLKGIATSAYLVLIILFLFAPAVALVIFSFNASPFFSLPLTGFTFDWYRQAFNNPAMISALENSIEIAVPTALISTVIGLLTALGLRGAATWMRRGVDSVVPLPLLIPGMIWSLGLLIGMNDLNMLPSIWTVLAGHVLLSLPFVVLLITTRLNSFQREWEEAASSLGAGRVMFVRRVFVPHMMPALLAGALMALTISFNDFIIAFFLTGQGFQTLPIYIYSLVQMSSDPSISAISSLIFVSAVVLFLLIARLQGREVAAAARRAFTSGTTGAVISPDNGEDHE